MSFPKPLTNEQRCALFGKFEYKHLPNPLSPERILITDDWTKNLVKVPLGKLANLKPGVVNTWLHRLVAPKFEHLLLELEKANCLKDILTFDGGYVSRFMRGRVGKLSSHAWGSAIDLNARWNPLGRPGAKIGEQGYMGRVAEIAEANGWAWGGRWSRRDDMHLEVITL